MEYLENAFAIASTWVDSCYLLPAFAGTCFAGTGLGGRTYNQLLVPVVPVKPVQGNPQGRYSTRTPGNFCLM